LHHKLDKLVIWYDTLALGRKTIAYGYKRTVNAAIAILVSFTNHLVNFVVSELLANRRHYVPQLSS
jgi:hypothetical protein